jgi:hypothetical protein
MNDTAVHSADVASETTTTLRVDADIPAAASSRRAPGVYTRGGPTAVNSKGIVGYGYTNLELLLLLPTSAALV